MAEIWVQLHKVVADIPICSPRVGVIGDVSIVGMPDVLFALIYWIILSIILVFV